ncbi:MAG: HAMP domain-containing sensor histidine kinase [Alphaproteobacteria bacterium]
MVNDVQTNEKGKPARSGGLGLSARVLLLTISFIMLAELLIFVPSISQYRISWLEDRLANAQIAALALLAADDEMVPPSLREELLRNAEVKSVVLQRSEEKHLILSDDMPPDYGAYYNLDARGWLQSIGDAFRTMFRQESRYIRVRGMAQYEAGGFVEIVIAEEPLCAALITHAQNIFLLSLAIALIVGVLLYLALAGMIITPLQRLINAMTGFRAAPESDTHLVVPSTRADELGAAESALAAMQQDLQHYLKLQGRQAALGRAVQKINHDLRNIFTTVQLLSDRLGDSEDPAVRRVAPRFIGAVDRALSMSQSVLKYGSAEEDPPRKRQMNLHTLVDEVGSAVLVTGAGPVDQGAIRFSNKVEPDFEVVADPDQLFRVLINISRNAVQAFEGQVAGGDAVGDVMISANRDGGNIIVDIEDNAGGVPNDVQARLFEPFATSSKADGTGLGLTIARELVEGHGGSLILHHSDATGSCFRICLPDQ